MKNTHEIFLISDSTGETIDRIFTALKAQFKDFSYKTQQFSFTRTENQISEILKEAKTKKNTIILYTLVDQKLALFLNELSEKDAKIYRIMFDASPISDDIRLAGFGGVDKYSDLEKLHSTEMIIDISKKTDQMIKKLGIQSKSLDELFSLAIEHR